MSPAKLALELSSWEMGAGEFDEDKPERSDYGWIEIARLWIENQELRRTKDLAEERQLVRYVVGDLIPRGAVGVLYGPPNVGKSFLALNLAHHVRRGTEWFGRRTEACDVLYCYGEGHAGMIGRVKALYQGDTASRDFAVRKSVPNLCSDDAAVEKLKLSIADCFAQSGVEVGLLIIDTFSKSIAGANEDSSSDMNLALAKLRQLAFELNVAIVLVHHCGKVSSRGMRGSSAILGDIDFSLEVTEGSGGVCKITVEKMRDAGKSDVGRFQLKVVGVGQTDDGRPVTSCVVDALHPCSPKSERLRLTEQERQSLAEVSFECERLVDVVLANGERRQDGSVTMKLSALQRFVPELSEMKRVHAKNFGRVFKDQFLRGCDRAVVRDGVLEYLQPPTRGAGSLLSYKAVSAL